MSDDDTLQFLYRFSRCGELCLGLFTSVRTDSADKDDLSVPTASTALPVSSDDVERKSILLAHCVATKSAHPAILDDDMEIPEDWQRSSRFNTVGHNDAGRTVCIHSLAVLPSYQGKGLGSTLLKAYIQRIEQSGTADRIALLAHGELIKFYEGFGFVNKGPSKAEFGGGNWVDMVSFPGFYGTHKQVADSFYHRFLNSMVSNDARLDDVAFL